MTDFWNDPPEIEEPPYCPTCGEPATTLEEEPGQWLCTCDSGHKWHVPAPYQLDPEDFLPLPDDFTLPT